MPTPNEAHYAALRKFGNIARIKEDAREVWSVVWLRQLLQDVRYGLRTLRRNPGFTSVVILTLALGIGMNTAVFSLVHAVLLRPLAYPNDDRLVWLADYDYKYESKDNWVSPAAYVMWRNEAHSFESMVAYGNQDLALITAGESAQERIASITDGFWDITGAQPALGRLFRPGEPNTMVLSHALFERRFGNDPHVIGKTVTVNGHEFAIAGVLPRDFHFLFPQQLYSGDERREIDAYIPLPEAALSFWVVTYAQWEAVTQSVGPAPHAVCVVGRLRAHVPIERARAEMETVYARIARQYYPTWLRAFVRLDVAPLKEKLVGNTRSALMVLFGAVGFVLLIATANVANLLLARASTRQREVAIRAAIGAGRARLIRQFLAESVLLALLGGGAGLLLARWALAIMIQLGSKVIPRAGQAHIDGRVLLFTLVLSLATGLLFGIGPALPLWRGNLHDGLKDEARALELGAGRIRVRGVMVAAELALAIVLLTGAGLMLKSFWRMNTHPPGFAPEKTLVMRVALSGPQYNVWLREDAYIHELMRRIGSVPGVQAVGIDRATLNIAFKIDGAQPSRLDDQAVAAFRAVSLGYLRALGVPLLRGDWPPNDESFDSFMVNETFARMMMGNTNPIGRHVSTAFLKGTIVGVVADSKTWQLDAEPSPEVYIPYQLSPAGRSIRVVVRTSGDPKAVAPTIRKLVSAIDLTQPVYAFQTLEQALGDSIAPRHFNSFLLGTFAATALAMALVGVYGVMAYSVTQRTHEIGIRMALGAQRREVVGVVVRQGMGVALVGIVIGVVAARGLTGLMASLLYNVKPNDPLTFAAVVVVLAATALVACCGPALRAARIDPIIALHYE